MTDREREIAELVKGIKSSRRERRFVDTRWYISRLRLLRVTEWTPLETA